MPYSGMEQGPNGETLQAPAGAASAGKVIAATGPASGGVVPTEWADAAGGSGEITPSTPTNITGILAGNGATVETRLIANEDIDTSAAISADKLEDGTSNKIMTGSERTKLAGIAIGATANSSDATLLARANHTGTQAISTVTNLQSTLDTKVAGPSSATDNAVVRFDATTGKLVQDSLAAVDDSGNVLVGSGQSTPEVAFGGSTSSHAKIRRFASVLQFLLGDSSDRCGIQVGTVNATGAITTTSDVNGVNGSFSGTLGGSNLSGTNTGNETATTVGTLISGATGKTTPVDADSVGLSDSAASNVLKKLTWANIKATLKTYFDTLYQPLIQALTDIAGITRNKGDLIVGSSSAWTDLAVGTDGYVLTADSAQTLGMKWAAASGGGGSSSITITTKTSNYTPDSTDNGKLIDCTSALTLSMTAAATLGAGWYCYVRNSISGRAIADAVVIDPNSTELIDGLSTLTMYHGEVRLVVCTGTAFTTICITGFDLVITSSGTFVTPPNVSLLVDVWGSGGSGAGGVSSSTGVNHPGGTGGGGGAHDQRFISASELTAGASVTVTIGAEATGGTAATNGNPGNATTFGAFLSACGGGGGLAGTGSKSGGGGGGVGGVGQVGQTAGVATGGVPANTGGGNGSGGAGASATSNAAGAASEDGGAGGGGVGSDGTARAGGQSKRGGGGGGGGGGYTTAEGNMASAAGGDVNPAATALSSGGGGSSVGVNSTSNGGNGADGDGYGGEGGGGGGGGNSINGGNGGNGGAPGGGGGGGGGGNTGGAGGNGGRGECRVKGIPVN